MKYRVKVEVHDDDGLALSVGGTAEGESFQDAFGAIYMEIETQLMKAVGAMQKNDNLVDDNQQKELEA